MLPLWVEFPGDKNVFGIDDQHLVGSSIMIKPITDQGATSIDVVFPGKDEVCFPILNHFFVLNFYINYKNQDMV